MGITTGLCVRRASAVVSMGGVAPRRVIVGPGVSQRLGLAARAIVAMLKRAIGSQATPVFFKDNIGA